MTKKQDPEKKSKESPEDEESELEEEVEETEENIDDNRFIEFLQPSTEVSAPVLEKIANAPDIPTLEQNLAPVQISEKENPQIDYAIASNEPNYSAREGNIGTQDSQEEYQTNVRPPVLESSGIQEDLPRQELLDPLVGRGINFQDTNQELIHAKFIQENRNLPFEDNKRKYKKAEL